MHQTRASSGFATSPTASAGSEREGERMNDLKPCGCGETPKKFRPDYLCGKPECESNTRGLLLEYSARIAELEAQVKAMRCSGNCSCKSDDKVPCEGAWRYGDRCPCIWWEHKLNWQPRPASKEGTNVEEVLYKPPSDMPPMNRQEHRHGRIV